MRKKTTDALRRDECKNEVCTVDARYAVALSAQMGYIQNKLNLRLRLGVWFAKITDRGRAASGHSVES